MGTKYGLGLHDITPAIFYGSLLQGSKIMTQSTDGIWDRSSLNLCWLRWMDRSRACCLSSRLCVFFPPAGVENTVATQRPPRFATVTQQHFKHKIVAHREDGSSCEKELGSPGLHLESRSTHKGSWRFREPSDTGHRRVHNGIVRRDTSTEICCSDGYGKRPGVAELHALYPVHQPASWSPVWSQLIVLILTRLLRRQRLHGTQITLAAPPHPSILRGHLSIRLLVITDSMHILPYSEDIFPLGCCDHRFYAHPSILRRASFH